MELQRRGGGAELHFHPNQNEYKNRISRGIWENKHHSLMFVFYNNIHHFKCSLLEGSCTQLRKSKRGNICFVIVYTRIFLWFLIPRNHYCKNPLFVPQLFKSMTSHSFLQRWFSHWVGELPQINPSTNMTCLHIMSSCLTSHSV